MLKSGHQSYNKIINEKNKINKHYVLRAPWSGKDSCLVGAKIEWSTVTVKDGDILTWKSSHNQFMYLIGIQDSGAVFVWHHISYAHVTGYLKTSPSFSEEIY